MLSYWERTTWLQQSDFTIVGAGIVGLSTALRLRERFPKSTILVLEKGILPQGASTKNAGFACFGSLSELVADLEKHSDLQVQNLVKMRYDGLQLLRKRIGNDAIDYQPLGGYELFLDSESERLQFCIDQLPCINKLLEDVVGKNVFSIKHNLFHFNKIQKQLLFNSYEGQIDTGKMMWHLFQKCIKENIVILHNVAVKEYQSQHNKIKIATTLGDCTTQNLLLTTNGFAQQFLAEDVTPARAQVLITKPINQLPIKGTFHIDEGYYYFRNIHNRILLGGGRNLDFKGETTTQMGLSEGIQNQLEKMLSEIILPNTSFEIDTRWSGIMGVGAAKTPIVKMVENNVYCGIRMGGMGVAIGSMVGNQLGDLL